MWSSSRPLIVLVVSALLIAVPAAATSVKHMNLTELSQHADKIFRGKVVSVTDGKVTVGGGQLSTATYRIIVQEVIRGTFPVLKNVKYYDLTVIGKPTALKSNGTSVRLFSITALPRIQVGNTYLFMTTRPSSIGLSTTVGLGQGIFLITRVGKNELAANELNNKGLFLKSSALGERTISAQAAAAPSAGGPIPYADLKQQIRAILTQ